MKNKGILKFKGSQSKGAMHFILYNGTYVSITKKTSRKAKDIESGKKLQIAYSLFSRDFNEVDIKINEDKKEVYNVFEFMRESKHSHYKKYLDEFVVLNYTIE